MKLPTCIKIGAYTYKVVRGGRKEMGPDNIGLCRNDQLLILLRKYLRRGKLQELLLHEILHGCHYNAGRSDTERMTGEQWVEATVHTLLQVIRDNPELIDFLRNQ